MKYRIIKFKAKRLNDGIWVEGDLVHIGNRVCVGGDHIQGGINDVEPSTVCQFTGLKDKNGKGIFENDLIQDVKTKVIHPVVWNPVFACYSFLNEKENRYAAKNFADYPSKDMLIVGNKFDRKEEK